MEELIEEEKELYRKLLSKSKYKCNGYYAVDEWNNGKKKRHKIARLIYQLTHNIKLSTHNIIHHIDKNKLNDSPENLLLMTQEEHCSIHGGQRKRPSSQKYNKKFHRK
jgi:hypothetical protein